MSDPESTGLTDAEFSAIGRVAVAHSALESSMETLIECVGQLASEQVDAFLGTAMFGAKLSVFENLLEWKLKRRQTRLAEFKAIISRIKGLSGQRKIAIHGQWANWIPLREFLPWVHPSPRRVTALKFEKGKAKKLTIEDAKMLAEKLLGERDALFKLALKTWPRLPSMSRSNKALVRALKKQFAGTSNPSTPRHSA